MKCARRCAKNILDYAVRNYFTSLEAEMIDRATAVPSRDSVMDRNQTLVRNH